MLPLVDIGLTDLPKSRWWGGRHVPLRLPGSDSPGMCSPFASFSVGLSGLVAAAACLPARRRRRHASCCRLCYEAVWLEGHKRSQHEAFIGLIDAPIKGHQQALWSGRSPRRRQPVQQQRRRRWRPAVVAHMRARVLYSRPRQ